MTELRFQPITDWALIATLVVLLLGLVLLVRPRRGQLTAVRLATLIGLRLAVVVLVLVAMARPTLIYVDIKPLEASLVLLVDDSRSMQVADSMGDRTRWDAMKVLLDSAAEDLARLDAKWDIKAYTFDRETHKVNVADGKLALADKAEGAQSAIGGALEDAIDREASGRVLAMLLLSDGAQRALAPRDLPPQVAAKRLTAENIPLYTFTFGQSGGSERADLSIGDLVTNETIFTEAPTEVRGQVSAIGFANQKAKVQLLWESAAGMEVVDTREIDTGSEGGGAVPVTLSHTPSSGGEYKVTLRVEPREGELVTTNNEVSTFVTVRTGGINVLYLTGAKRIGGRGGSQEQRFVRAALARSPDIVVQRRLLDYEPLHLDLRDAIADPKFDVVILDDVDATALNTASWQALAERVRDGLGLMMLGGYHSFGPGGFRDNPLRDVLPVEIGPAQRQSFGEAIRADVHLPGPVAMRPAAPMGTRHPIMRLGTEGGGPEGAPSAAWSELPPLDGANLLGRDELKPNAIVLAEADDAQRHPLLVAGQSGEGRTLAFAGDSTWRWAMRGFDEAHRRFWRQAVLWLAKKDEQTEGRVWIRLAGRRVMRDTRVDFTVGAETVENEPIDDAQFEIRITKPSGESVEVRPARMPGAARGAAEGGADETWGAIFRETTTPGDYVIAVTARRENEVIGTAEARFLVPDQDLELDRPAAEPTLMAQLAEMTKGAGGAALAPEELPDLLKRLADEPPELKEEVIARVTYWDTWPFFLLFVGLLGAEWFLRKRWGLV